MNASADGILLVSKPASVTSHDVVERVRRSRVAAGAKVGHAGTLDPFATGLLLVLIGRATRVQRYLMSLPKTYRARARFGATSDTGDPTGMVTPTGSRAAEEDVTAALPRLTGTIAQRVPLTSAVKVGGERLYRKARRGEQFETPVREVRIARLEALTFDTESQCCELEVECSSGTYVRRLVEDLGDLCGAGAYCDALERVAVGPFLLEQADDERLIPTNEALAFMPERALDADETRRASHGRPVERRNGGGAAGPVRLTSDGRLVAVAEPREDVLKPVIVLAS